MNFNLSIVRHYVEGDDLNPRTFDVQLALAMRNTRRSSSAAAAAAAAASHEGGDKNDEDKQGATRSAPAASTAGA